MGAQRLSAKNAAKWARRLGLPIISMTAHGGYTHNFVTDDHRHGWVDIKTGEWEWSDQTWHYSSCDELFTGTQSARAWTFALYEAPLLTVPARKARR